ncbi:hypothetical protein P4O66_008526 [Electrophorus voltai]|uniref:ribonuclease H n=1 Tax=Electrophorus voltai TaxID=2609070 RepID=A0AAD8ZDN8_9TELE|nr:hypothetical protein P4O66_008526 [Electrophorus voltai]
MSLPIFSTTVESPEPPALQSIPQLCRAFSDVLSKVKATKLPPHRAYDCAVELLPGAPLPCRFKPYPLSRPEEAALAYVTESLQHGFIRPSTSPVTAGFFFVEKKGGLRLCIDYQALNKAFMDDIFQDMIDKSLIVYIDDILVFSRSETEHVDHVMAVLTRLRQHQLYAKAEKCEFCSKCISFLGCTLKPEALSMDPDKVTAIQGWPKPITVKELQCFLGFANFYRRFILGIGTIAAPLSDLLKKQSRKQLQWTSATDQAFLTLKGAFVSAPVLRQPDPSLPFIVEVDASDVGLGAVLSQRQGTTP